MKEITLYNTLSRKEEIFQPISNVVRMYCCGPTVYNYAHIGNLRTYIFEDVLKRTLIHSGYKVKHVINITDVGHLTGDNDEGEDKIEKSARETGKTVWEIADFYTNAFLKDFNSLNLIKPDLFCRATDHIQQMINLIKKLEDKGYTYISGGNVYFSIDKFKDYGRLARLKLEELKAGARTDIDNNKKNPRDFVLWFTNSKFSNQIMMWDSPWGRGYPGWHIECSAMSMNYLGDHFDIHCGGIDAIPVHHTNEIAQSEAVLGSTWVKYWLHGEFLLTDNGKMSKSSGEFLTLNTLVSKGYDPLDYKFFCYSAHYRSQLSFSLPALDASRTARLNLLKRIGDLKKGKDYTIDEISDDSKKMLSEFDSYVNNDMSIPRALGVLFLVLKNTEIADEEKFFCVRYMDEVLGLNLDQSNSNNQIPEEIADLLALRDLKKKNKDWNSADKIRNEIESKGYIVKDTPNGSKIEKKI